MSNNQTPDITGLVAQLDVCAAAVIGGDMPYSDNLVDLLWRASNALEASHTTGYTQGLRDAAEKIEERRKDAWDMNEIEREWAYETCLDIINALIPKESDHG